MATGLDYGAIDFLIDGDQIYVIDINCVPGIEQLEAISGENIMRKLLTANFFSQLI
jgi:glutathione synthase/RimK-type ligase-like ATP-grasp enzyme